MNNIKNHEDEYFHVSYDFVCAIFIFIMLIMIFALPMYAALQEDERLSKLNTYYTLENNITCIVPQNMNYLTYECGAKFNNCSDGKEHLCTTNFIKSGEDE